MFRIVSIFICLFCFANLQSTAQVTSTRDSLQNIFEQKRIADSTRIAIKKIAIKKRQDSVAQMIKFRQLARKKTSDSLRVLRKQQRDALRKQNKDFNLRKKERERIRDSVQRASEKAALARKAYNKSLKKQKKKTGKSDRFEIFHRI